MSLSLHSIDEHCQSGQEFLGILAIGTKAGIELCYLDPVQNLVQSIVEQKKFACRKRQANLISLDLDNVHYRPFFARKRTRSRTRLE